MAEYVRDIKKWLERIPPDERIGIDNGGLTLRVVGGPEYYEIGGLPEEEE
jgi:hypothetical protein